jgi:hypothetical protein
MTAETVGWAGPCVTIRMRRMAQNGYSVLRAADVTTERLEELWDSARQIALVRASGLRGSRWPTAVRFRSLRSR